MKPDVALGTIVAGWRGRLRPHLLYGYRFGQDRVYWAAMQRALAAGRALYCWCRRSAHAWNRAQMVQRLAARWRCLALAADA